MKKTLVVLFLGLALLVSACRGTEPTSPPEPTAVAAEPTTAPTESPESGATGQVTNLQDVRSATIRIQAEGSFYDPDGNLYSTQSDGSGFIIDPSGIAITNNHVVGGAGILRVWLGGESESRNAQLLGISECADLAVIDIEGDGYPYLEWYEGDLNVGLPIYAAGFPLGDPEYTLLQGIISKEKAGGESDWASVDSVIEHTALTNPGSSGGPIVTEDGQAVAVHYAGDPEAEQHFAITRAEALPIIEQLRAGDDVDAIGINPRAVAFEDGLNGVWVTSVRAGSAADKAGIKGGDLITKMAGMTFLTDETLDHYTMADYCDILRTHGPESTIDVEVVRFDTEEVLEGQLNGRPLEATFSFAKEGEDDVTDTGESYSNYVKMQDDTGAIQIEVPAEWDDVDGRALTRAEDGIPFAASIVAAPDLDAYWDYQVPGIEFSAQPAVPGKLTVNQVLDIFDYRDECEYVGREPYSDSLYTGAYDHYTNCAETESALFVVASFPEDETFVNTIVIKALTDADLDAADHALATFQVTGDLPQTGQGTDDAPPSGDTFALTIGNRTPEPICGIYVIPSDADGWGANLLGSEQLEAGAYWSKEDLDAGATHDLLVKDCTDATLGVRWQMDENMVVNFGGVSETVNLLFENETGSGVCELYISPSDSGDWGADWLGQTATAVTSGRAWRFWLEPGTYDLLARDCEGEDLEQVNEVDLSQSQTWTLGDDGQEGDAGDTFEITVTNQSPQSICSVSIVPSGTEEGNNQLGTTTIESGQSKDFAIDAGAAYDVWANDCDDAYLGVIWDVDQPRELTIGGSGRTSNLLVKNNLEVKVCEIKISPSDADDWGDDWLQEEGAEIRAGKTWRFWVEPGTYDVIARDCDGEDLEQVDKVDLSKDRTWTLGKESQEDEQNTGADFYVSVNNLSPQPICSVTIAPTGSKDWGPNLLKAGSLKAGQATSFGLDTGTTYDVAARDCDDAFLGTLWTVGEEETLTIGGDDRTSSLLVQNDLDVSICKFFIEPPEAGKQWKDMLVEEGAAITPGSAWRFWVEPGEKIVVAQDCDGNELVNLTRDLSQDQTLTLGDGQEGSQGDGSQFSILVSNQSLWPICSVKIAPSDGDGWGDNWLESPVEPDQYWEFFVETGTYDVSAQDCVGAYLGILWDVEESETLTIGGSGRTLYFHVKNDLEVDVCEIKVSPVDSEDWGEDWLQEEGSVITAGSAWRFWVEPGIYDVLARDCQGEDLERIEDVDFSRDWQWVLRP